MARRRLDRRQRHPRRWLDHNHSFLLAKYPEPQQARAALTAAIQQAGGENAAAQAEAPTTATRAAAGNGRKLGYPAHLA